MMGPEQKDEASRANTSRTGGRRRPWRFAAPLVFTVLFMGSLGIAEILVRTLRPPGRVQVVRETKLVTLDGVPYWEESTDRHHLDCARANPDAYRILVLGDSIFYGSTLPESQVFSTILEGRLRESFAPKMFCVMNYSQPGFSGQQKVALAKRLIPSLRPHVVLWEVWQSDLFSYVILGDSAYNLTHVEVDGLGYPNVFGLPGPVNAWLFETSRLYEYAMLALAPRGGKEQRLLEKEYVEERMSPVAALAREAGARLMVALAPPLDRPFESQPRSSFEETLSAYAEAGGHVFLSLAHALAGRDYLRLRSDPCCHYNAEGHQALVDVFFAPIVALLGLGGTPEGSGNATDHQR